MQLYLINTAKIRLSIFFILKTVVFKYTTKVNKAFYALYNYVHFNNFFFFFFRRLYIYKCITKMVFKR